MLLGEGHKFFQLFIELCPVPHFLLAKNVVHLSSLSFGKKGGNFCPFVLPVLSESRPIYPIYWLCCCLGPTERCPGAIGLPSYQIVLLRCLIGSLFLWAIFLATRQRLTLGQHKVHGLFLVASGAAMGCAWIFLYEAYQRIGVSMASLAYYCGPVIIMVLSPLLFGEKLTRTKVVGFLAVLVGVVLVNGQARPWMGP